MDLESIVLNEISQRNTNIVCDMGRDSAGTYFQL